MEKDQLEEAIARVVGEIHSCKTDVEHLEACVNDLKAQLRDLLEEHGGSWSDSTGYARLVGEGERTYYDTSALDKLIIEDPLRYGWLKDYRLTSAVQGRVQVK